MVLSIILVSYNEVSYIREAIESCINQKIDTDFEVIIGDDGSTDGSIDVIKEYANNYPDLIKYYVMKRENEGEIIPSVRVSNLLKRGFSFARGDYILLMSADDLVLGENRVKNQIDFLNSHMNYSACYTDYQKFWKNGEKKVYTIKKSYSRGVFWALHYVHLSCFIFRKEVLSGLLDVFCDDTGLIFSIIKNGKIAHINSVGFGYRQREKSIMADSDKIELALCEMLLYQDILNSGGLFLSSMAHFARPMLILRKNYKRINNKYNKYVKYANKKNNNVIQLFLGINSSLKKRLYVDFVIIIAYLLKIILNYSRQSRESG